jgi:NAD(P)H-binding
MDLSNNRRADLAAQLSMSAHLSKSGID